MPNRLRWTTYAAASLLFLLAAGVPALAFQYRVEGPQGSIGLARPSIALYIWLESGESIAKAAMWLDGQEVPASVDGQANLISYTPPNPLPAGDHRVRVEMQVTHPRAAEGWYYEPLVAEWRFTVAANAIATLPEPDPEALRALAHVNTYRHAAGLSPMVYNNALGAAAAGHARYLVANAEKGHDQRPGAPHYFGVTPADRMGYYGYYRGGGEVIAYDWRAETAIDGWMQTIYHRVPLVHPGNLEMGYGQAGRSDRANVINTGPGAQVDQVALWPYPGQTGVPVGWDGAETPSPFDRYPNVEPPIGYSVSVTFGNRPERLTLNEAKLLGPDGAAVPVMIYAPDNDPHLTDTVGMIPHDPLAPESTYQAYVAGSVDFGAGPQPYEYRWSFTTADHVPLLTPGQVRWEASTRGDQIERMRFLVTHVADGTRVFMDGLPVRQIQRVGDGEISFEPPLGFQARPEGFDLAIVPPAGPEVLQVNVLAGSGLRHNDNRAAFRVETVTLNGVRGQVPVEGLRHVDGHLLVPVDALADLGAEGTWISDADRGYYNVPGSAAGDVMLRSAVAYVDGKHLSLPLPVQNQGGKTYVPVEFAAALFGSAAAPDTSAPLVPDTRTPPAPGTGTPVAPNLTDLSGHWARAHVEQLVAAGVVAGFPDGTYRPDDPLTRGAFVKMLAAAAGLPPQPGVTGGLADVNGHWLVAQGYLGAAVAAGLILPGEYPGARFDPDVPISREEIAVLVVRYLGLDAEARAGEGSATGAPLVIGGRSFIDSDSWRHPGYVRLAVEQGIVTGYPEPGGIFTFRPERPASRAEAAVMVVRAQAAAATATAR